VGRAFIRVNADPIPGGCRLNVKSFHKQQNDTVSLWLIAEVLDTKTNQLRTITLSTLENNGKINPNSFRGDLHYDINYDDVNKFLQARNPNLKLNPGHTSLAVAARWSNGHQAGGFGRGGVFRLPPGGQTQSVIGVRTAQRTGEETDLPLDMQVAYPPTLVQQIPGLKPDGNILSRLESELKGTASKQEMTAAVTKMYELVEKANAGDTAAVEKALGKGWTVETVNRYWLKDDGSAGQPGKPGTGLFKGFRVDDDNLPMQDPMHDVYMDDANLGMTRQEGAIRLRTNKQATVINVKPGGGRLDERTNIRQRVEFGLEMNAGSTVQQAGQALQRIASNNQFSGTVFNQAQRETAKLGGNVVLSNALQPWLDVTQDRHKFTVKNDKGVEIEFSFDKVKTKTLRPQLNNADGTPREAEFFVLEAELDHLQLQSTNQSTFAAAGTTQSGHFSNDAQQDTWLKGTSDTVTMDIDPRLHELKDLENKSFRSTGSYKSFEKAQAKIIPWLFPQGLGHGRQKAAHAADVLGLVMFDDTKMRAAIKKTFTSLGYEWNDALKTAYDAQMQNPAQRVRIEQNLINGNQNNVYNFMRQTGVNQPLKFNISKMKQRVKDRLHAVGFESSAEIEKMFDNLATKNIAPNHVESYFQRMGQVQDNQVMNQWAQALGVTPVPQPRPDAKRLFGEDATYGQLLRQQMTAAQIDPKGAPEIEAFFQKAIDTGKTNIYTVRSYMQSFSSNPENYLQTIANQTGLAAEMPTLHANPATLMTTAQNNMNAHYLKADGAFRKFLDQVCASQPRQQAQQFVNNLRSNPQQFIDQQAKALNIAAPKLGWDFARIDQQLQQSFTNTKMKWTDEIKDFAHKCIEEGVPVAKMQQAFNQMQSQPTLKQAFAACQIYLVGLQIPDVEYDKAAVSGWVQQTVAGYQAILGSSADFDKFVDEGMKLGLTPSQLVNYASYCTRSNAQSALRYTPGFTADQLPSLPYDVNNVVANLKTRMGTNLTPEREKYIRDNFDKAVANPQFQIRYVFNQNNVNNVMNQIALSGVARPQGV
jgi:hypothetical protein